ncbi:DUF1190 domain-containing protein [Epibacterium ulvae]|uniref:DUF1190 domain-containing protein n=1 Tax=Epibacterium ulvae TaxID=1156985 RepID=UPI0024931932|nr:DUF1190 domain-containing protein [Epibacterium ulvae]
MKRSKSVTLVAMAGAAVSLSACDPVPDSEGAVYTSEYRCIQGDFVPDADCAPLFAKGKEIHESTAPRYATRNLCEDQHGFGQCESAHNYVSPRPYGYLIAGSLATIALGDAVRPVYPDRKRRGYYMTGGSYIHFGSGRSARYSSSEFKRFNADVPRAVPKVQTRTTVASRNGFGSRSGSFGG